MAEEGNARSAGFPAGYVWRWTFELKNGRTPGHQEQASNSTAAQGDINPAYRRTPHRRAQNGPNEALEALRASGRGMKRAYEYIVTVNFKLQINSPNPTAWE